MQDTKKVVLQLGATCPTLKEQLTAAGIRPPRASRLKHAQSLMDAVVMLYCSGMMSESDKHKIAQRVLKRVAGEFL